MKKETKKKVVKKPKYIVDLTTVQTIDDVKYQFAKAKALAGVKLTKAEVLFIAWYGATVMMDVIDSCINEINKSTTTIKIEDDKLYDKLDKIVKKAMAPKKDPWYKRAWNWITKPFKKNK